MRLWFLFMHLSLVPHCTLLIDLNLEVLARLECVLQSAVCFVGRIPIKDDNSNNNNNLSFSSVLDTCDLLHWLPISASLLCCVLGCAPSFFCGLSPDVAACLVLRSPTRGGPLFQGLIWLSSSAILFRLWVVQSQVVSHVSCALS